MYQLDMERIRSQFTYLTYCYDVLQKVNTTEPNQVEQFALARAFHIGVECMIDVGSHLIDGFMMRDPGGYEDIMDILTDEKVIPNHLSSQYKEFVRFREKLVRAYETVDVAELIDHRQAAKAFLQFIDSVEAFLQQEVRQGHLPHSVEEW